MENLVLTGTGNLNGTGNALSIWQLMPRSPLPGQQTAPRLILTLLLLTSSLMLMAQQPEIKLSELTVLL
ncbi:hypothetical protein C789_3414 [Microcystis aeruginosa FACHB-905 = DIANCHI905]|nr:hypothetical protein [Microcystis aeruginosa]ELS46798.1 hypothetical protein C789_3414 [Microcystis aeruginosa FACHB-905 = DIANCHI905]UGS07504.1 hypothetical protein LRR78_14675 [Microcystis aeruginosa FACHB-905 = DIANCHI905]WKX64219.1 hypothetical protein Q3H53_004411 [Microcystis aeruginosa PCC 7806]